MQRKEEPHLTFWQALVLIIGGLFILWPEDMATLVLRILGIE